MTEIQNDLKDTILRDKDLKVWGTGHTNSFELCSYGGYMVLKGFNQIHGIETFEGEEVVKVDSGVTFSDLNLFLFSQQKALGYAMPQFGDISIGGFVANDGHGSNAAPEGSDIVPLVRTIDKMDQRGRITTFAKNCTNHNLWKALMSDQGMLGITVTVRLKIRELFNLEARILNFTDEQVFTPGGMKAIADECQNYMGMDWFTNSGITFVTCGTETTMNVTAPDTWNRFAVPYFTLAQLDGYIIDLQEGACNETVNHLLESERIAQLTPMNWIQYALNGQVVDTDIGVGYNFKILEVTALDYYLNGLVGLPPQVEFEVSIPESMIDDAMAYIKAFCIQNDLSFPIAGVVVRVGRYNNESWLGQSSIGEDDSLLGERAYYIEILEHFPFDFSFAQLDAYLEPIVEIYRYLVKNFKGRLHTGKNLNNVWLSQEVKDRYSYVVARFQEFVEEKDSFGIFSNELAKAIGVEWPKKGQKFSRFYYYKK